MPRKDPVGSFPSLVAGMSHEATARTAARTATPTAARASARAAARTVSLSCLTIHVALLGLLAMLAPGLPRGVGAAAARAAEGQENEIERVDAFAPLDYSRRSKLERAERFLQEENFDDALPLLASLLDNDAEDYFLDALGGKSLKRHIRDLLAAMPANGFEAWEAFYGAAARHTLAEGLAAGSLDKIEEVMRRYPLTAAASTAGMLLGRRAFDAGRPLAAAFYYDEVRRSPSSKQHEPALSLALSLAWARAGNEAKSMDALFALREHFDRGVRINGSDVALPTRREDVPHWLARHIGPQQNVAPRDAGYLVFRGSAARNDLGSGDQPLARRRWRAVTYVDPREEEELLRLDRQNVAQGRANVPAAMPVATSYVDAQGRAADVVLARSLRHLLAVDFATGRVLWQVDTASVDAQTHVERDEIDDLTPTPAERLASDSGLALLAQRMWEDAPYGQLSTDGQRVYSVDGLGLSRDSALAAEPPFAIGRSRWSGGDEVFVNRLAARDLAGNGKLAWQVGGTDSPREARLAGAFFLGPPLPVEGTLYAIAEIKREVRLVALEAATGKLVWQQQLVPALRSVGLDPWRRRYGATPAMAAGVLVCPTSAGAVVAVDVARRSLLWGDYYGKPPSGQITPWGLQSMYDNGDESRRQRWADVAAIIDGDKVLVAPADGDQGSSLYCLDLMSGEKRWEHNFARRENLFVAGVRGEHAIVVGADSVQALRMADGSVAWTSEEFGLATGGERCLPSGRGYANDERYYLPLSSGELVAVSLADGTIVERRPYGRQPLGNLICYRGELVSCGVAGLEVLWQTDALERRVDAALAKNENESWAWARRGELLLDVATQDAAAQNAATQDAAKFDDAVAAFRRAIDHAGADDALARHTSQLLAGALLDRLQTDFAAHREMLAEVDRLVGDGRLRERLERVAAAGLQQTGDHRAALERYLKIIGSSGPWDEMIEPDVHRRVRRDAWMRAQLAALVRSASPAERDAIDAAIRQRIDAAVADGRLSALRAAVAYFGDLPASALARARLVRQLIERGEMLAAEQHALRLAASDDRTIAAEAAALLGDLYVRSNQFAAAASQARKLEAEFADARLSAGGTGHDAAAAILAELALRDESTSPLSPAERHASWPTGHVKVEIGKRTGRNERREVQYEVPVVGPRGLLVGDGQLILDRNAQKLLARDALGNDRLQVSMMSSPWTEEREIDPYVCVARERGHLLILSAGDRIVAINGLGSPADPLSTSAWEQPLKTSDDDGETTPRYYRERRRRVDRGQITKRWGEVEYRAVDSEANVLGVLGPITDAGVCYQRGRELMCVESATGKLLWTVDNMPPGCELFGDAELLFAAPHESLEGALVFRMADGELLGRRHVPSEMSRMATLGRDMLVWGQHEGKLSIGLVDAWSGKRSWNREVAEGTVAQVLRDRVAVLEPAGKFAVIDIASGEPAFEQPLLGEYDGAGQPRLVSLHVIASDDQMIVIANRNKSPDHSKDNKVRWITRQMPLVTGRVYALNPRTGTPQWPVPAEVEDQGLVTSQPPELPLLVFMRHFSQGETVDQRTPFTTHVYCLDKRTGGAVMHRDPTTGYSFSRLDLDAASAYGCRWTGDPAARTVTCALPALPVTFRFTAQPMPPEPPAQLADRDPDGEAARQARAIGSFFKELGRRQVDPGSRSADDIFGSDDDLEDE